MLDKVAPLERGNKQQELIFKVAYFFSRDSDHEFHNIDSNSVYIVSVTDVGDGRLRIEFYVMVRSGVAYDTDTLENAVKVSVCMCLLLIIINRG